MGLLTDFTKLYCPYCVAEITQYIHNSSLYGAWIIRCPVCNKKIFRSRIGGYQKKETVLITIAIAIVLLLFYVYYYGVGY